ncbi:MAG: hypothetical protein IT452_15900 [Planctomycetia bacterium]|nr:hypothetical protein [Planctomycetia bacterium]
MAIFRLPASPAVIHRDRMHAQPQQQLNLRMAARDASSRQVLQEHSPIGASKLIALSGDKGGPLLPGGLSGQFVVLGGSATGIGEIFIPPIDSGSEMGGVSPGGVSDVSGGRGLFWMGESLDEAIERFLKSCKKVCEDLREEKEDICRNPKLTKEQEARCWKALYDAEDFCKRRCKQRAKFAEGENADASFASGFLKDLGDSFTVLEEFALWVAETQKDVGKDPTTALVKDPVTLPVGPTIVVAVLGAALIVGGVLLLPVGVTVGGATVIALVPPAAAAALLFHFKSSGQ